MRYQAAPRPGGLQDSAPGEQSRCSRGREGQRRALALSRLLCFRSASTNSSLPMFERPSMPALRASSYSAFFDLLALIPPAVWPPERAARPPLAACLSDGPFSSLSSQWSPFFSATCLTAANAVRCARSSLSYSSCALSSVLA